MIKAFLFDYGGVMTAGGGANNELSERLASNLHISIDDAIELINPLWLDYIKGKLDSSQFWASLDAQYGKQTTEDQRNIWNTWEDMKPKPEMFNLVQSLKARNFNV